MNINALSVKRKRIKKTLFNAFASKKNNYFNVNITYISEKDDYLYIYVIFLNELNNQSHLNLISNDFNILNIIN